MSTGSSDASGTGGGTTSTWDLGTAPDLGPPGPAGCGGAIDFLFVVSSYGAMEEHQGQLAQAVPAFISSIGSHFPDFDVHIMVVDGDDYWAMTDCSTCGPGCDPDGSPPLCGAMLSECDTTLGAGVTFPAGEGSSNRRCVLAGGQRYLTREETDLTSAFECVATLGSGGSIARPANAMIAALGAEMNDGGCNAGFLREGALLVVTIISRTYDFWSIGPVDLWLNVLRDAKGDDDDAYAVLVLTTDIDLPVSLCSPGEYVPEKNRLRVFAESAKHGWIESICVPDYAPFFDAAIASLVTLCDELIPR